MAIAKSFGALSRRAALLGAVLLLSGWTPPEQPSTPPASVRHALPTADVLIDAGHGGIDSGTHWGDIMEKDINLAISSRLYLILRSHGVRAVLNRTGDYALSDENRWHRASRHTRDLSQRGGLTEEIQPRMFVSIHVNWSPRGRKRGPLVLHQAEGRSALLASFIQDGLNRQQRANGVPTLGKRFYVLNRVRVPSVIVETTFLNDPLDRAMLTSPRGQTRIAHAIAEGILAYRCVAP
ncbi:N-acetylmuramoyl-L-alanine amidase family protein [Cohnella thermotolerans]|uniref:N-acetylmuramoyl-L-alanine amidase family protein n=1 Tax=Cohnella thermotolerans TaxID=329858 RepID=UPI000407577D|nr:N-acetylmuramoyl-L-alanine amidase [Cohnella thermotolerans]